MTVRRYIESGDLEAIRVGGSWRVLRRSLEKHLGATMQDLGLDHVNLGEGSR